MKASIRKAGPEEFYVELRVDGEVVDEAGPFDDELDALEMSLRAIRQAA